MVTATHRQTLEEWRDAVLRDLSRQVFHLPAWEGDAVEGFMHDPIHACPLCGSPMEAGCDEDVDGGHHYEGTDTCYTCRILCELDQAGLYWRRPWRVEWSSF